MNLLLEQLGAFANDKTQPAVSLFNNMIAVLYWSDPKINWAGIYFVNPNDQSAFLGPFQGKPACMKIMPNKGVIGHSINTREIVVVDDVHKFDGHIACDSTSRSEIVFPLFFKDQIVAVLDIDSDQLANFSSWTSQTKTEIQRLFETIYAAIQQGQ